MSFEKIIANCFINAPFEQLRDGLLDLFLKHHLQPEIGLDGEVLYDTSVNDFQQLAIVLRQHDLRCTLHAPFFDLSPGASDSRIRRHSREKLHKAFGLIEIFKPVAIVCHLNYEELKYGSRYDSWFQHSLSTWRQLIPLAARHGTKVSLENTYEKNPRYHQEMFTALTDPDVQFCLDVGHVLAFAKNSWQEWLLPLEKWFGQVHLHDNNGEKDSHWGVGEGAFPFDDFFAYLKKRRLQPIVTLEPHSEEALWQSLTNLEFMRYFE